MISPRFDKLHSPALAALLLAACSSDPATPGTGGAGGHGTTTTMMTTSASSGGAGGAAPDPYETAVKAASWVKLPAAPSVTGGAKQDDMFFLDAMHGFIASGPKASIFSTTDGGATWTSVFASPGTYFRALFFTDAQHGLAGNIGAGLSPSITDTNVLYATSDGGGTWAPVTTITGPTPAGLCNLTAPDATHLFGVGRANGPSHLLASSDGGATWTSKSLSQWLTMAIDARFVSPTEGIVAGMGKTGSKCTIIRTTDGGTTFAPVFTAAATGSLCWKLSFPSDHVGYVAVQDTAGGPGTFGKTTDGGLTWQELPLPATTKPKSAYSAIGVGFITDNIGWMSAEDVDLPTYRTIDGGLTWEVDPVLTSPINRFRFVDANTAYAIGADAWKLTVAWPGN
jgi:photosystem II stability/assembly factor-like uncharacterized protein